MSEKKKVEKPEEKSEEKHDANAESSCTYTTSGVCGIGNWGRSTTSSGCGRTTNCGTQNSWS